MQCDWDDAKEASNELKHGTGSPSPHFSPEGEQA